ncbi:MAG: DUF4159 domain-containing protein [Planctomycetaceae bacterium]
MSWLVLRLNVIYRTLRMLTFFGESGYGGAPAGERMTSGLAAVASRLAKNVSFVALRRTAAIATIAAVMLSGWLLAAPSPKEDAIPALDSLQSVPSVEKSGSETPASATPSVPQPGVVNCANLVYGLNQSSVCFSSEFLSQVNRDTHIRTLPRLIEAHLESVDLFQFPYAVMTGEGPFTLTPEQRRNMRDYLQAGGFIVASAGCSSQPWRESFLREIAVVFPELSLQRLEFSHPIFHTVYDIDELKCKGSHRAQLEGLEIDGKIGLIFSADGLNDTANAGGNCCCCGGNEIKNSRQMNVNMLAYTLTH